MPRSKKQFSIMREKSRKRLMDNALELFAVDGYENTSISDIANKAGVAKGTLYHYFKSKEDLLQAIFGRGAEEIEQIMTIARQDGDPYERLENMLIALFNSIESHYDFWRLYLSLMTQINSYDTARKLMTELMHHHVVVVAHLFKEMGKEHPEEEAFLIGATLDGAFLHYFQVGDQYPLHRIRDLIVAKYLER